MNAAGEQIGSVKRVQGDASAQSLRNDLAPVPGRRPASKLVKYAAGRWQLAATRPLPASNFGPALERRNLSAGSSLYYLDRLATEKNARLNASLNDGTTITLGEDAELLIDEYVYDPRSGLSRLALDFVKGAFVYTSGKIAAANGAQVHIRTPVATVGIRGTKFWGGPIDGGYGILVLEGSVVVTTSAGSVILPSGSGTMIYAANGFAPQEPSRWAAEKLARALASVGFDVR